jgi:hypothetical protein
VLSNRKKWGSLALYMAAAALWYNEAFEAASSEFAGLVLRRDKLALQTIVMLKRLSEAISQSNIENNSLASETHGSHHSSCNFSPKERVTIQTLQDCALSTFQNRANGGVNH